MSSIEGLLRHERTITAFGLIAVIALAWLYLWSGAGMGMSALDMTAIALFPHRLADAAGAMNPSLATAILMWWTMMIAMMTPSAAPLVLLYRRVLRHYGAAGTATAVPSLVLLAGYLTAWLAFSVGMALLQNVLQPTGLMSGMMLWSKNALFSAAILGAAGVYQFSPFKRACLKQCRSPVNFLMTHWRPGVSGSFMLGIEHGAYCVGCCWMLMALLFVGGMMNLVWIAALSFFVFLEKLLPVGEYVGRVLGGVLIVWAGVTLLV